MSESALGNVPVDDDSEPAELDGCAWGDCPLLRRMTEGVHGCGPAGRVWGEGRGRRGGVERVEWREE